MPKVPVSSRGWIMTLNNYSEKDVDTWKKLVKTPTKTMTHFWFQKEKGESGTEHLQGFVRFKSAKRMSGVKKLFGNACHVEPQKGRLDQAIEYCKKEETRKEGPWGFGEYNPGKRTDLENVSDMVKDGSSVKTIAEEYPVAFIKFNRGIDRLRHVLSNEKKMREVEVIIKFGVTGSGKSYDAWQEDNELFSLDVNTGAQQIWFDGYDGEKTLLLDEFYGKGMPFNFLLKVLDVYPLSVPVKGAFTWAKWTKVIITSNLSPNDWYVKHWNQFPVHWEAFKRRISKVEHYLGMNNVEEVDINTLEVEVMELKK